jgi:dTDP-4-dehydrorhamnose reductase
MKIAVLGSTGMLGNAVTKHFIDKGYDIICTHRNDEVKITNKSVYFDANKPNFSPLNDCDFVLNCVGVIKPFMNKNMIESININSLFPRQLADYCQENDLKLIHITTDCVFSGKDGNYDEDCLHDCLDEYGKSKSLGEPKNCMVVRTSIIGEEIHKNASLIAWAKSMRGKEVNGFTNHLWNGVTTKHYAEICEQIIQKNLFNIGMFHVHSNTINKFDLLHLLNNKFSLDLKINEFMDKNKVDRSLSTKKDLLSKLKIKDIKHQIEEL